jgi:hypothetical protein
MFSTAAWFRPEYGVLAAKLAGPPGEVFLLADGDQGHFPP